MGDGLSNQHHGFVLWEMLSFVDETNHSTQPFEAERYAVVRCPSTQNLHDGLEKWWFQLNSTFVVYGAPHLATQLRRKAPKIFLAVVSANGVAFDHPLKALMQVGMTVWLQWGSNHIKVDMWESGIWCGESINARFVMELNICLMAVGASPYPPTYIPFSYLTKYKDQQWTW